MGGKKKQPAWGHAALLSPRTPGAPGAVRAVWSQTPGRVSGRALTARVLSWFLWLPSGCPGPLCPVTKELAGAQQLLILGVTAVISASQINVVNKRCPAAGGTSPGLPVNPDYREAAFWGALEFKLEMWLIFFPPISF